MSTPSLDTNFVYRLPDENADNCRVLENEDVLDYRLFHELCREIWVKLTVQLRENLFDTIELHNENLQRP